MYLKKTWDLEIQLMKSSTYIFVVLMLECYVLPALKSTDIYKSNIQIGCQLKKALFYYHIFESTTKHNSIRFTEHSQSFL